MDANLCVEQESTQVRAMNSGLILVPKRPLTPAQYGALADHQGRDGGIGIFWLKS